MSSEKVCFIISPIGEPDSDTRKLSDEKYDLIFKPVLEKMGYTTIRADKENSSNSISRGIVTRLLNSALVIADATGFNANVFYELAIRNAIKKPVIIVKELEQKLPFDVNDKRAISINMKDNRQWTKAKEELEEHIINAEKNPKSASESIVSEYAFDLDVGKTPNTEQEIFLMIKDLKDEVRSLRIDARVQAVKITQTERRKYDKLISIELGSGARAPKDKNTKLLNLETAIITVGQSIVWINNDTVSHTITSGLPNADNVGEIFDSGLIKPKGQFSFTFNEIGAFQYFDIVHPWIIGMIHVI